jgi:CarD family transcriptional regulator
MFKVGEYLIYRKSACKIIEIIKNQFNNNDYYVLIPIDDSSLKINVPINNCSSLRPLITKDKLIKIIKKIPDAEIIESDNRLIENEYKKLMNSGEHEDLIRIIKTTYLKNKFRTDNNKKISEKDDFYFNQAEKCLYNEFSLVLGISYEEAKTYVINAVANLSK